jgi:hypothetical protein
VNLASDAEPRQPDELLADIRELIDLLGAVVDPIIERILPVVQERLGEIELAAMRVELHLRATIQGQVEALPGNPAHN